METPQQISPQEAIAELQKHILVDGFHIVIDFQKSWGCHLVDATDGREFVDLYGFFGSLPVGFNHPYFDRPEVKSDLLNAARIKVANSDVYSTHYARFVKTFHRVAGLAPLDRYFFIEGGALAVENALKAAMDWKVRKNLAAGKGERGTQILHLEGAFHGRSGYTLSLTNTDPGKTCYFASFNWPRISTPSIDYSLPEPERTRDVQMREKQSEAEILSHLQAAGDDIAALIIEPVQGEGGDNHFRGEWLRTLRQICDANEVLLIFDEIQTGLGMTGKTWCCNHFDVIPDLLAFGKKFQVCGVMAGPRLDEVPDNVFRLSSRINSTWGGNLTDMVRSTHFLHLIAEEGLVEEAARTGQAFLKALQHLQAEEPLISAVRGRGLMLAFDLPDPETRDRFYTGIYEMGLLPLKSGPKSIRFRPALDFPLGEIPSVTDRLRQQCDRMRTDSIDANNKRLASGRS